jgi:triphosphatase
MEIELKLSVAPSDLHKVMRQRLLEHFVVAGPATNALTARYFDTGDSILHRHGLALRVHRQGSVGIQTLKRNGGASGALEHEEWEVQLAGPDPDLDALRHTAGLPSAVVRLLRNIQHGKDLQEKFVVDVDRQTWQLRVADSEIDMALDDGMITCGASHLPIAEIGFERKSGDKVGLYALAAELARHIPVQLSDMSKAARGYALCLGKPDAPRKAATIGLSQAMSVDEGMRRILGNCLHHAQANAPGILETDDPEYLHQMRVGLRRFRSATKLCAPWAVLPPAMQEELAWLGTVLGNARDHHVFLHSTLPALIEGASGEDRLRQLQERAGAVAAEKCAEARRALHSPRYGQCMLSLFEWVDCSGWRNGMNEDLLASLREPLAGFARKAVERGHAKIEKRGKQLHRQDSEALHRLRIACKQNRYAVEFFRDQERGKRAAKYIKALSSLQDTLGWRNDLTVAQRIVHELQEGIPELSSPAAFASGYLSCRAGSGLHEVRKPWRQFSNLSPKKLFY